MVMLERPHEVDDVWGCEKLTEREGESVLHLDFSIKIYAKDCVAKNKID